MTDKNLELESLKLAIKTEQDGKKMYLEAADRVKNPLAVATFKQLAKEEDIHIEVIKKFYEGLASGSGGKLSEKLEQAMSYNLRKKTIFEAAKSRMDETVSSDPDLISAYDAALKFEEDGAKMYEELTSKTEDSMAKELYKFMNVQENEHYRLLAESKHYLEHPDQWFIEEEKPHFEG